MKLVTAILRPHRVDDVRAALGTYSIHGMTLSQVTGFGTELWRTETYRGRTFHDESVSAARIECVVADSDVEDVVSVILRSAGSTASGAGKIWVLPVETLTRVRTGERGLDAL
ncbi:nitrogen regulatory protein P-II family [Frankia torreyi]|uniref:Nitrogen regulatory protein P-II family n=1 Tax=Frankia torreyi TaxID=1856 RepID=A0A0D8BFH9_9ACTN|nr:MULTISPECIES: P-II family nitrogen regulator [Frankia]KJE22800.1 nitrogen regulatory protein P-II family [Frankia torreyi]KQC40229.1 transcriptional regulator [Frankia sp. ACN1ag]